MSALPQRFTRPPRLAPLAAAVGRMLRLLSADEPPDWNTLGELAAGDPVLTHALLRAAPLDPAERARELPRALAQRLETLGSAALQVWLLGHTPALNEAAREYLARRARLAAECAMHLAIQSHYPHPDEAYLAGLWHSLGQICISQWQGELLSDPDRLPDADSLEAEMQRHGTDSLLLAARLAESCGASEVLCDALLALAAPWETLASAHPLTRLLRNAVELAAADHAQRLPELASRAGMDEATLLSLRTDCSFLAGERPALAAPSPDFPIDWPGQAEPAPPLPPAWQSVLGRSLLSNAFAGLDSEASAQRLALACPLLFERRAPLMLMREGDLIGALPLAGQQRLAERLAELNPRVDDAQSVIALCLRSGTPTRLTRPPLHPGRSALDWHLARWLGGTGFICLPLADGAQRGVALFALDEDSEPDTADASRLNCLLGAAFAALNAARQRQAEADSQRAQVFERLREHARRIAHEARNPLSVIRSYLQLFAQRQDETLRRDLPLLDAELDRLDALVRRLADPPADDAATEPPLCDPQAVLEDMRRLHAEALFAQRGIQFELRSPPRLPRVMLPASALRQVLLNLFLNAAEALHPGGKFSVSVPGVVNAGGRISLELRLIDNGPGLPPERMSELFSAQASPKGGAHEGVGLSMVKEILDRHQALLLCRSQAGAGTSFQIFMPLAPSR